MRRRLREPAEIAAEIGRIRSLSLDAVRQRWRLAFGRTPPADLGRDLLGRMLTSHLQERAFGGLDRESLRFLESLARHGRPLGRELKSGTVLVREYQGERHVVTVTHDGFDWKGTTYSSLSAIARAITGTVWSGPRFFAVRGAAKRKRKSPDAAQAADARKNGWGDNRPAHGRNAPPALHLEPSSYA